MVNELKVLLISIIFAFSQVKRKRICLSSRINNNKTKEITVNKKILVDISCIIQNDLRTGIQRVVRAISHELIKNKVENYDVFLVYATSSQCYRYANNIQNIFFGTNIEHKLLSGTDIQVNCGDIFIGLDLATSILPRYKSQLEKWKIQGMKIHIFIFDLLPMSHPKWFRIATSIKFNNWLRTITVLADSVICISESVKNEYEHWTKKKYNLNENQIKKHVIPMAYDISGSFPSTGLPKNSEDILSIFRLTPTALMVGTVEPRKGHEDVISGFEKLWAMGYEYNLCIVGKQGWKCTRIVERISNHQLLGKRLFWINDASDEFLTELYTNTYGLIYASNGEGYGLPIIEAISMNKPVLARDLSVFREVQNNQVKYFNKTNDRLENVVLEWFNDPQVLINNNASNQRKWDEVTKILLKAVLNQT